METLVWNNEEKKYIVDKDGMEKAARKSCEQLNEKYQNAVKVHGDIFVYSTELGDFSIDPEKMNEIIKEMESKAELKSEEIKEILDKHVFYATDERTNNRVGLIVVDDRNWDFYTEPIEKTLKEVKSIVKKYCDEVFEARINGEYGTLLNDYDDSLPRDSGRRFKLAAQNISSTKRINDIIYKLDKETYAKQVLGLGKKFYINPDCSYNTNFVQNDIQRIHDLIKNKFPHLRSSFNHSTELASIFKTHPKKLFGNNIILDSNDLGNAYNSDKSSKIETSKMENKNTNGIIINFADGDCGLEVDKYDSTKVIRAYFNCYIANEAIKNKLNKCIFEIFYNDNVCSKITITEPFKNGVEQSISLECQKNGKYIYTRKDPVLHDCKALCRIKSGKTVDAVTESIKLHVVDYSIFEQRSVERRQGIVGLAQRVFSRSKTPAKKVHGFDD